MGLSPVIKLDDPNLQDIGNEVRLFWMLHVLDIFVLGVNGGILLNRQGFVTWGADCIGALEAHGLDQNFRVPRVRFEEDALFSQADDSVKDANLLAKVLMLADARSDFDLKGLLQFGLIPVQTVLVADANEVVAMNHKGEFLCGVLEATWIGDPSDKSQVG